MFILYCSGSSNHWRCWPACSLWLGCAYSVIGKTRVHRSGIWTAKALIRLEPFNGHIFSLKKKFSQHGSCKWFLFYFRLAIDLNAQGFLRLLDSFQIWWSAREKTFQHFIKKYPNIAETPSNKSICFKHPAKKLWVPTSVLCSFLCSWIQGTPMTSWLKCWL